MQVNAWNHPRASSTECRYLYTTFMCSRLVRALRDMNVYIQMQHRCFYIWWNSSSMNQTYDKRCNLLAATTRQDDNDTHLVLSWNSASILQDDTSLQLVGTSFKHPIRFINQRQTLGIWATNEQKKNRLKHIYTSRRIKIKKIVLFGS